MAAVSGGAELFLGRMDPARALETILGDVDRLRRLDPKLQAAVDLLQDHFRPYAEANAEILGTALWSYVRQRVQGAHLKMFRAWLDDGAAVLRAVESATGTLLATSVLDDVVREATTMLAADAASTSEVGRAHAEIQRFLSVNILAPLIFLAAAGLSDVYMEYVEGYTFGPPPPPPPPPPPHVGKEVMHS